MTIPTDFSELFRDHILRSMRLAVVRVQYADAGLLTRDDRKFVLHTLTYGLELPAAWSLAYEILLTMTPKMEQAGYRDDWIHFLEQGVAQSRALQQTRAEAELRLHLGVFYQLRGKYETARQYLTSSIWCFQSLKDAQGQARALNRQAYVARLQGHYTDATSLVQQALGLLDHQDLACAFSYFIQGTIALDTGDAEAALASFRESLRRWEKEGDNRLIAQRLLNMGTALRALQRYNDAITSYKRAILLFEMVQDPVQQAVANMNLGNVYLSLKRPEDALTHYKLSEPALRNAQDETHLAMLNANFGIAYRMLERWQQAETALQSSIERWQRLQNSRWLVDTYDELGMVYLCQGLWTKAAETFNIGLRCLTDIEGDSAHDQIAATIKTHLCEAQEQASHIA